MEAPYVGPVRAEVAGRTCFVGAMVFGDEVLPGAIPMKLRWPHVLTPASRVNIIDIARRHNRLIAPRPRQYLALRYEMSGTG